MTWKGLSLFVDIWGFLAHASALVHLPKRESSKSSELWLSSTIQCNLFIQDCCLSRPGVGSRSGFNVGGRLTPWVSGCFHQKVGPQWQNGCLGIVQFYREGHNGHCWSTRLGLEKCPVGDYVVHAMYGEVYL